jgi:excisionase family DNA binding protein
MPLLKIHDVATRLSCSQATVYALVSKGKLIASRIGVGRGGIRVRVEDLDKFIQDSRQAPTEPATAIRRPVASFSMRHFR